MRYNYGYFKFMYEYYVEIIRLDLKILFYETYYSKYCRPLRHLLRRFKK